MYLGDQRPGRRGPCGLRNYGVGEDTIGAAGATRRIVRLAHRNGVAQFRGELAGKCQPSRATGELAATHPTGFPLRSWAEGTEIAPLSAPITWRFPW